MRNALIAAALAILPAAASHANEFAESDQIAQQKMIGVSARGVRACMGAPAKKSIIGATQIWVYPSGSALVEGGPLSLGVNGMASFFGDGGPCNVNIVLTNAAVSQIYYSAPDGGPLPLGALCTFAVGACAEPPVVRAKY